MATEYPFLLAGQWRTSREHLEVRNPYNGDLIGVTFFGTEDQLEESTEKAVQAFGEARRLTAFQRSQALRRLRELILRRETEFVETIVKEAGKPWKAAALEVQRALFTLETASEEAKRIGGEVIPMDLISGVADVVGIAQRFPVGPVAAITPFNFPLNLALHKIAPALAVGNPIVIKPASKTPLTLLLLGQLIGELGLPPGMVSVIPLTNQRAGRMVADDRYKVLTFTGSAEVGWSLKAKAGKKRVVLELGGNAGVVVDQGAPLERAVKRIVAGGYSYAGQSCISVQRVFVHYEIFDLFTQRLVEEVKALKVGDPMDRNTDVGPLIDEGAARRTEEWCQEAIAQGASALVGGSARGNIFEPTVLVNVDPKSRVCRQEVFAPVVVLFPFHDFAQAIAAVNDTGYGLQAGVFTQSLEQALYAYQELEVGGVIINEVPTFRMDHMPYGGTKDSGLGREGLRYAIEEMTEIKLLAIHKLGVGR